jgi:hypothetical protein
MSARVPGSHESGLPSGQPTASRHVIEGAGFSIDRTENDPKGPLLRYTISLDD